MRSSLLYARHTDRFQFQSLSQFFSLRQLLMNDLASNNNNTDTANNTETANTMGGNTVVGLLGGGQLGRMLCEAAGPLGIDVAVLDEAANSPAKQAHDSGNHVTGSFKDPAAIRELAARADLLTVEIEHVDTQVLEDIETNGVEIRMSNGEETQIHRPPVHPSWRTLRLIQDKYLQKAHFLAASEKSIPVAEQLPIEFEPDSEEAARTALEEVARQLGLPFMLKARKGSYDGRGNFTIRSAEDYAPAIRALGKLPLYAEKWAPFVKELAVMVIRTEDGEGGLRACVAYPAVETVHEDSICTKVFMPPRDVAPQVCEDARKLACDVVSTLWGRGVFAVEMFVLEDGSLMVNEVAPRPHNSGHYTIEAVPYMSQYQAQLHAVLDLPIPPKLTPRVSSAIMINILGGAGPKSHHKLSRMARTTFHDDMDVYLHLYGKEPKPGRKIGHITLTGFCPVQDLEKLAEPFLQLADEIREERIQAAAEQLRPVVNNDDVDSVKTTQQQQQPAPPAAPALQRRPSKKQRPPQTPRQASERKATTTGNGEEEAQDDRPLVLVTMGSDSDLPVLKAGLDILREFQVPHVVRVTSAHRTPRLMMRAAEDAAASGIKVIIAAAGGAAHLPGMVSSETPLPVIGVPVKASQLDGMDSLLSIVQMPRGVPTATVGINNSTNAALLAIRILGTSIPRFQEQMIVYQHDMEDAVIEKDNKMQKLGGLGYLESMKTSAK